ncbi:hypothetical protein [Nocardiopsis synnemataformans]|uniref:hypothetical protein n=1 Tax=Nocardiopsis synnemataformans TaxID=61305 RepID=UPI003EBC3DB6
MRAPLLPLSLALVLPVLGCAAQESSRAFDESYRVTHTVPDLGRVLGFGEFETVCEAGGRDGEEMVFTGQDAQPRPGDRGGEPSAPVQGQPGVLLAPHHRHRQVVEVGVGVLDLGGVTLVGLRREDPADHAWNHWWLTLHCPGSPEGSTS